MAAAYAEVGKFKEAIATEEKDYAFVQASGDAEASEWHSQLLEAYRAGEPHRESTLNPK